MAVTKDQVFSAAAQIAARGDKPTLEGVRKITGGSYTTISPAFSEWKARENAAAAPVHEPAPPALAERLAELGSDLWSLALDVANRRLASEREGLERIRAALEAESGEAIALADKLAGEVEVLQSRQASIEDAEQLARNEIVELRQRLAKAQEQVHTAEVRAQEIDRRAVELRTELDRAHEDVEAARHAREEVARLAGQVETLKEQSAALLARITPAKGGQAKTST